MAGHRRKYSWAGALRHEPLHSECTGLGETVVEVCTSTAGDELESLLPDRRGFAGRPRDKEFHSSRRIREPASGGGVFRALSNARGGGPSFRRALFAPV